MNLLPKIIMKLSKISNVRNIKQPRIKEQSKSKIITYSLQNSLPQLESNYILKKKIKTMSSKMTTNL